MRIAHVDSESGLGGGQVQLLLLLEGLARAGADNVLFSPPHSAVGPRARDLGIEWRAVAMRNDLDVLSVMRLVRGLRDCGAELVHLHTGRGSWLGGLAARVAGLPVVSTRRMDLPIRRGLKSRLTHALFPRRVVAISPAVENRLRVAGVPPERIVLIPSAVNLEQPETLRPRELIRAGLGAGPEDVVVFAAGALRPSKGHDVLLDALGRMDAPPLVWIAGEGPLRDVLEQKSGPNVRLLGLRSDIQDLLSACDIFVMPSRHEGLGVAALEAMAARRPVVATAVGGLSYAVKDGCTGLLVDPDDPEALAEALRTLAGDPELRRKLGDAGAARVREHFSAPRMVAAYQDVYRRILADTRDELP